VNQEFAIDWESCWSRRAPSHAPKASSFGLDDFRPFWEDGDFEFGENLAGIKSITDLSDLIKAKDKEFQVLHDAVKNTPTSSPPWGQPPNDYASWYHDYMTLLGKWQPARANAMTAISASTLGAPPGSLAANTAIGQPWYNILLGILQPTPGTTIPGDLTDLHTRLNAVQTIPAYTVSQPTQGADQQLGTFQALRPFDPLGDLKAAEDWKKYAILGATVLVGGMLLMAGVAAKVER